MARTLILCPTFNHADTLFMSVASARAQTDTDWDMHVILDGAPDRTVEVIDAICRADPRIRYSTHAKAARTGEEYRDPAIRQSDAEIVVHLGDDDIWAPDHLTSMTAMLQRADWVNEAALSIGGNGSANWIPINSGIAEIRRATAEWRSPMPGLNAVGYRRATYLGLPTGWTSTPWADGPSDRAMWSRFFQSSALVAASTGNSTVFRMPSTASARFAWPPEARMAELGPFLAQAAAPGQARARIRQATVLNQAVRLFGLFGGSIEPSFDLAMHQIGFAPTAPDGDFDVAVDGALMALPLTASQRMEFDVAHAATRHYVCERPMPPRHEDWLRAHLAAWIGLVRTILADSEVGAMRGAQHMEDVLGKGVETATLRANLLSFAMQFEAAETALAECERRWPDHPRTRHARTELAEAMNPGPNQSWLRRQRALKGLDVSGD